MPFACLTLNITWEIMSMINSFSDFTYFILRLVWVSLDLVVLIIHFIYGNTIITKETEVSFVIFQPLKI